jgi:hypothetical protein
MKRHRWWLLALAALAWFEAGIVWVVQFSGYPLWGYVGRGAFPAYFEFWQRSMWYVAGVPFALTAAGSLLLLILARHEPPRSLLWLGTILQFAAGFLWSWVVIPTEHLVAVVAGRPDTSAYRHLVAANWLVIAVVTAYAALALGMFWRTQSRVPRMGRKRGLLFVTSALGMYAVGNIWFVHLVSYALWPYVGKQEAYAYHLAWWHSIWGVLFIPAGAVLLGSIAMLRVRPDGVSRQTGQVGLGLQLLVYLITAAWFGPLMARLASPDAGLSLPLYHLLMTTHWVRLALFTAYGILCLYMLAKSATGAQLRSA